MAAVYQAMDLKYRTTCAIKEMSVSNAANGEHAQAIQNFLAEAKILSRLKHPNLPAFTDFFTEGSRHFLVMEYIDGNTLEEYLERNGGPYPERRVLTWARQLCDVLAYLHSQKPPIIFRDVKPGNIMLDRNGHIKLIDFGIARIFRPNTSQDTQLLGTPGFAPPEQYGSAQTDERSDLYSLAITLFQLLTDTLPDNGFGLKDIHANNPQISPQVARALEKATALEPEDRYENMAIFKRALLGVGNFPFEHGDQATTPEELAQLCQLYPDEAADYIFSGEIETWLQSINAMDLARQVKRIRATVGDPHLGVERFLQSIQEATIQNRPKGSGRGATTTARKPSTPASSVETSTSIRSSSPPTGRASSHNDLRNPLRRTKPSGRPGSTFGSRGSSPTNPPQPNNAVWEGEQDPTILVHPTEIDFGPLFPGISEPLPLSIAGNRGRFIRGILQPEQPWIKLDRLTFEGAHTTVYVQVDSTQLPGPGPWSGSIMIASADDEIEADQIVEIKLEALEYPDDDMQEEVRPQIRTISKQSKRPISQFDPLELDLPPMAELVSNSSKLKATPLQSQTKDQQGDQLEDEQTRKYGPKDSPWEPLRLSSRKNAWYRMGLTFFASLMAAELPYGILSQLAPLAGISFLPPGQWFVVLLLLMVPLATGGALLVNWEQKNVVNQLSTSLCLVLITVGLGKFLFQNVLDFQKPTTQLILLLLLSATSATIGTNTTISRRLLNSTLWAMKYMRWLVTAAAVFCGGLLGFILSAGFAFGCLTGFSVLLGISIAVMLVLHLDRMLHPAEPEEVEIDSI